MSNQTEQPKEAMTLLERRQLKTIEALKKRKQKALEFIQTHTDKLTEKLQPYQDELKIVDAMLEQNGIDVDADLEAAVGSIHA